MKTLEPTEDQIQVAILDWLRRTVDCVAFHIPNGGARSKATGALMKRLGVLAGAPDLCVLMADETGPLTVFIEVKRKGGYQTESQREFETKCREYGHDYIVARSLDDVREWFGDVA
jgi:VRR-NUC domain